MSRQNGGIPKRTCFPTRTPTSWARDHIAITGFPGIGWQQTYSLLGCLGSRFHQEQWGYPDFGFCICNCPSAGHDMVMLDYRECGPEGEPAVVHVDRLAAGEIAKRDGKLALSDVHQQAVQEQFATFSRSVGRSGHPAD